LAGGLKKNVAKVTGNDQKEAEGNRPIGLQSIAETIWCSFISCLECKTSVVVACDVALTQTLTFIAGKARQTKGDAKKAANK